jgi:hypothetical protein
LRVADVAPLGFTAQSLSGGRVEMHWQSVAEAVNYEIFRMAPGNPAAQYPQSILEV